MPHKAPVLMHDGSNSMNLAKILVDPDNDLAVVAMKNFPDQKADAAAAVVVEQLYRQQVAR